jgi:hypothetical protein
MPVFSLEWVLMQNYETISKSCFDDKHFKNKVLLLLMKNRSKDISIT